MKEQVNNIIAESTVDKDKRLKLTNPTTEYELHKNLMKMKAVYGNKDRIRALPDILEEEVPVDFQRVPVNKVNFSQKYDKLKENTNLKKDME